MAAEVHRSSGRKGPFVCVSSGELIDTLFADALFGHNRGAFTGALVTRKGAFAVAAKGTLLLDDLAVMPRVVQPAILRVVESGWFSRLGAEQDERATCRLLLASTLHPDELARRGRLLPDLASRLGQLVVDVPPLCHRRAEIMPIANEVALAILREHGFSGAVTFSDEARVLLQTYDWPSNVRELRAVVERAVIHAGMTQPSITVRRAHLPDHLQAFKPGAERGPDLTASLVHSVLRETKGNKSEAARRLDVPRNKLARFLKDLGG